MKSLPKALAALGAAAWLLATPFPAEFALAAEKGKGPVTKEEKADPCKNSKTPSTCKAVEAIRSLLRTQPEEPKKAPEPARGAPKTLAK